MAVPSGRKHAGEQQGWRRTERSRNGRIVERLGFDPQPRPAQQGREHVAPAKRQNSGDLRVLSTSQPSSGCVTSSCCWSSTICGRGARRATSSSREASPRASVRTILTSQKARAASSRISRSSTIAPTHSELHPRGQSRSRSASSGWRTRRRRRKRNKGARSR